jgi:hypothetical protein
LAQDARIVPERVVAAVERALPPVQQGLKTFGERKAMPPVEVMPALPVVYRKAGCISCHHEGFGLTTVSFLRRKGFAIDEGLASQQASTLHRAYKQFGPLYGQALGDEKAAREADFFQDIAVQMGYMLGGLLDSGQAPDATTEAAARLLPKFQQEDGSWSYTYDREPMQSSDFATTALAARVLYAYAPKDQAERTAQALASARRWLVEAAPETTDDLAFRLLGLKWLGASPEDVRAAAKALRAIQRDDGGWAQLESAEWSDAYATGLALLALHEGGGLSPRDRVYQRGVAFLLETQKPDGTWQARKWAHAYNRYFDAGFPYGKSQYLSIVSTCYAMMALAHAAGPAPVEANAFRLVDPSGAEVASVAASRSLPAVR